MGDSDDDGDYKRRDKFRNERGSSPPPRGGDRRDWGGERGGGGRDHRGHPGGGNGGWGGGGGGRRGYDGGYGRRDRYSPPPPPHRGGGRNDMSPPMKRMRGGGDWDDHYGGGRDGGGGGGYRDDYDRGHHRGYRGGGGGGGGGHHHHHHASRESAVDDGMQPAMMSFKAFLGSQDDTITDEEAIKKYAEYKLEFKRQQLNEFFVNHKDEEWFKLKYHPEESTKRKNEMKKNLEARIEVFNKFWNKEEFEGLALDADNTEKLTRLLDSCAIILEGGTDFDLKVLDMVEEKTDEKKKDGEDGEKKESADDKPDSKEAGDDQAELQKKAKEYLEAKGGSEESGAGKKRKRKRTKDYDEDASSGSDSSDEDVPPGMENVKKEENADEEKEIKKEEEPTEVKKEDGEGEDVKIENEGGEKEVKEEEEKRQDEADDDGPKPRPLHKTSSIFLRNLAPTITMQEIEAMCKRYPGFLRAAIADPDPARRWFRRGWISFERGVKIKEICYSLNSIRLRDCELGPIVNRDLTRRIRTVNGITVDKKVVRNDIKLAAKVINNLDQRWGLWKPEKESTPANGNQDDAEKKEGDEPMEEKEPEKKKEESNGNMSLGLCSNNPVLHNITDYLIEEASAEEEELLGRNNDLEDGEEGEEGAKISRDDDLLRVLDRMIFYLRIVHSIDFYNHSEYPNEDEMPNRCGIMHARAVPPSSNVGPSEIEDYCASFEKKMGSFLQPRADLTDDEAQKLGMKNEEDEVEKFVMANTQELGKDKWLCPLSGKKFKGPDFVRKHIFNKHGEKVEEVKKEVQFYNNYLKDPKRPQLTENPGNKGGGGSKREAPPRGPPEHPKYHYSGFPREATSYPVYDRHDRYDRRGGDGGGYGGYGGRHDRGRRPDHYMGRGGGRYDNYGGGGGAGGRPVITYRDLDAPRDTDEF